jgi:hypothetical protein
MKTPVPKTTVNPPVIRMYPGGGGTAVFIGAGFHGCASSPSIGGWVGATHVKVSPMRHTPGQPSVQIAEGSAKSENARLWISHPSIRATSDGAPRTGLSSMIVQDRGRYAIGFDRVVAWRLPSVG